MKRDWPAREASTTAHGGWARTHACCQRSRRSQSSQGAMARFDEYGGSMGRGNCVPGHESTGTSLFPRCPACLGTARALQFEPQQVSRFLVAAEASGLPFTLCLNKADLVPPYVLQRRLEQCRWGCAGAVEQTRLRGSNRVTSSC